jgi:S1-C subfamily serine protease
MVTDTDRDLALLRPLTTLEGGLVLGNDGDPPLEKRVCTWGFPLMYNGPAPLLSVGYVAGYSEERAEKRTVKHLVINGAFNPGNSGGPLLEEPENKLIGIVVAKYHLYPPYVKEAIETLAYKPHGGFSSGRFSIPQPDGTQKPLMDDQVIGLMLEEFYKTTQVMIGEAISISELKEFLASKENELR